MAELTDRDREYLESIVEEPHPDERLRGQKIPQQILMNQLRMLPKRTSLDDPTEEEVMTEHFENMVGHMDVQAAEILQGALYRRYPQVAPCRGLVHTPVEREAVHHHVETPAPAPARRHRDAPPPPNPPARGFRPRRPETSSSSSSSSSSSGLGFRGLFPKNQ